MRDFHERSRNRGSRVRLAASRAAAGEALFDHHLSISAAGLPTIPRESSWSLRRKHCEELFAEKPNAALWLATFNGKAVDLRELLQAEGFLLSTERLVHTV